MKVKKSLSREYLIKALEVFGILGLDMVSGLIGGVVDGERLGKMSAISSNWYAQVFQLILTISFWSIGAILFYRWIKKEQIVDKNSFKVNKWTVLTILLAVAIWFFIHTLDGGSTTPKFIHEYQNFLNHYGSRYAVIISILQNIYYVLEISLVAIMIILLQKAGELKFKLSNVPWGGVGLALTWGMIHFISHSEGAFIVPIAAFLYGVIYVVGKKRIIPLALVIWLPFFL